MKPIAEILEDLKHIDVSLRCSNCGATMTLIGKQYSIKCKSCGIFITLTPGYLVSLKIREEKALNSEAPYRAYKCKVCKDNGYVIVKEQLDNKVYEFLYKCFCPVGQKREECWPVLPVIKIASSKFQGSAISEQVV